MTVAIIVIALVVIAAVVVWSVLQRQRTARQLLDVIEMLGEPAPPRVSSQAAIERLERSADRVRRNDDTTRTTEVRLARALDEVTQGVVVCDANGEVRFRNAYARAFAAARHGEALVEAAIQAVLAAARDGERAARDVDLYGPPARALSVRSAPLHDDAGTMLGAIAIVDDRTERQLTGTIRRDFVANVSHELKTPIAALSLLAETLTEETDPAIVRRLSGRMRDEALRVSGVVDDLLTLSRIESADQLVLEPLDAGAIVAEAVDRVHPVAERRGVTVRADPAAPGIQVHGDRRQLASALFNLLENAVKYSEAGSTVDVHVVRRDDATELIVQDHGIGIPSRDLERIFERFYRVDKGRARDTGGTGLGLAIVRHVARNHGGDVKVVSREGEGSVFTIVLPDAREPVSP